MALNRDRIVDTALAILREHGLAGMSMRRVALELGVQPGALYHHVGSKQELLVAVGETLLAGEPASVGDAGSRAASVVAAPLEAALALRRALLAVRDGAEVVAFVHAYRPGALGAASRIRAALEAGGDPGRSDTVAELVVRFVLGFVTVEQNAAELARAGIGDREPGASAAAVERLFQDGVTALLSVA